MAARDGEQVRALFAGEFTGTKEWFEVAMLITNNDGTLTYAIRKPGEQAIRKIITTSDPAVVSFVKETLAAAAQVSLSAD